MLIGFFVDRDQFFRSYLVGYLYWLAPALGSLALASGMLMPLNTTLVADSLMLTGEMFLFYAITRWVLRAYRNAMTDQLTRLFNRSYMENAFSKVCNCRKERGRRANDGDDHQRHVGKLKDR